MDIAITPAALLRAYVWSLLKKNLGWSEADYGGLVPVIPVSEEPELNQYNKPFVVYGYVNNPSISGTWFRNRGSMTFVVYSTSQSDINKTLNVLKTALEREDMTAFDVNNYTSQYDTFKGIRFGTISVGMVQGPAPEDTEGGRTSGMLNIRFEYYVDYDVVTAL